jgi:quinol monooxygenase YgiN
MRFASRDGSVTYDEGLATAFELFRDGRIQDAAMMFLVYADPDAIGIVGESEYNALAAHFKEMMAFVKLYEMICHELAQPLLSEDGNPAYKVGPAAEG